MKLKVCTQCLGTGDEFNGTDFVTCTVCKGEGQVPDLQEDDFDDYLDPSDDDLEIPFDEDKHTPLDD